jgi:hypothetical protein
MRNSRFAFMDGNWDTRGAHAWPETQLSDIISLVHIRFARAALVGGELEQLLAGGLRLAGCVAGARSRAW